MNKINLGCGWECRDGWLNVDNTQKPQKENYPIEFMDVTKTWPYEDNYFDYALSEHMIEHIRDKDNLFMLKEALRTLKPGGVIRITCPDRTFYENLVKLGDHHPFVINYSQKIFNRKTELGMAQKIMMRTLNEQGHVWIPTEQMLVNQLKKAGFKKVKSCKYGVSEHSELNGIELNDGVRNYESLCVEGTK
tara:strand:- start:2010 stop:2582 length:573 start_codon:yes stop_codon:yes gene_type:complete